MTAIHDFKAQLAKQIGFLERSASLYDDGFKDEAFRIATSLRVIFHQTRNSTSLITHLGSPNALIRTTVPDQSRMKAAIGGRTVVGQFFISLATLVASTETGGSLVPKSDPAAYPRMIGWQDWWTETFASINNHDYTRSGLVLWAANKDGGAHVDERFPPEYEAIKASAAFGEFEINGKKLPVEDAHLVFLRSMAFEILSSHDFRALAV